MSQSFAAGIDLGTTSSALARVDDSGRSSIMRSQLGELLIPSIVYFEDDELVFGGAARQAAATEPGRAAESVKRDLGEPSYSRAIGGELLRAEVIEACLLKKLAADLAYAENNAPAVALSLPSCFNQAQRRALLDAGEIAGLDLLGTIDETLAAALALAESQGYLHADAGDKTGLRVLVFDLGGGKLDVAIVEIKPRKLRTMASGGDARLGGRDWDLRLADFLAAEYAQKFGQDPRFDMVSVRRLLQAAEETKHTLTARTQARVRVERGGNAADIVVTREAFETATADLVERARAIAEQVLARASMAWRDLAGMLLVGGSTRMPMIVKMLEALTGLRPIAGVHADEAVARGAALVAEARLAEREHRESKVYVEITNLTAHSLGLVWADPASGAGENVVLIPRGSELPCATVSKAVTDGEDQTAIMVQLLEGESRAADECARIARLNIRELPLGLPRNWAAEVHFQYTAEGQLQVKAQMPKTGQPLRFEVDRNHGLTIAQVAEWKALAAAGGGLKAIQAQVGKEKTQAKKPPPLARVAWDVPPPAPEEHPQTMDHEGFEFEQARGAAGVRKRQNPERTLLFNLINVTGFVVFSLLGLAIGYYILMMLRPEWNVYHLRLPGLR